MGFVPTDVSFNLTQLMDINRGQFKLKTVFPKLKSEGNTTRIDIMIDLAEHIMADKKIKDS